MRAWSGSIRCVVSFDCPGPSPVEVRLQVRLGQFQARRHAVQDAHVPRPVALAGRRQPQRRPERVPSHDTGTLPQPAVAAGLPSVRSMTGRTDWFTCGADRATRVLTRGAVTRREAATASSAGDDSARFDCQVEAGNGQPIAAGVGGRLGVAVRPGRAVDLDRVRAQVDDPDLRNAVAGNTARASRRGRSRGSSPPAR